MRISDWSSDVCSSDLSAPAQKIFLDVRVLATQQLELFQDRLTLRDREGRDPERLPGMFARVADHRLGNMPRLVNVGPRAATDVVGILQEIELQPHPRDRIIGARYDEELVLVEFAVRHRDYRLVLRSEENTS